MKKKMFIIIGLLVLVISVLLLISYIGNKKKIYNIETLNDAMEQNNIKETNTIAETKPEENDIPYNQVENVIQENTIDEKTETLRNNMEAKENTEKNNQNKNDKIQSEKGKTEENKSTDTKENTSYTTPTTNGNSNESKPTTPPASNPPTTSTNTDSKKPTQTIDRITQEEYDDEIESYLNDIMKIKPNLKYVYEKRGQVFYPYRTEEIKIAVGKVSFGTIYYYVEKFVEGNQEKFKYYIDWAGN